MQYVKLFDLFLIEKSFWACYIFDRGRFSILIFCFHIDTLVSGSPLIQNGKFIGAVTRVLLDDSTKGYAIFAENMLETAQSVGQGLAPADRLKDAS